MPRITTRLIAALVGTAFVLTGHAQLRFEADRHEFGTILWNQPGNAVFRFRNVGRDTISLRSVRPDCGCTAVRWTSQPIPPKGEGRIEVRFDAALLGHFEKQVAVYTNRAARPTWLTISGDVARREAVRPANYTYRVGDLYFETDDVEFDNVRRGDAPVKTLAVYNAGRQTADIQLMHLPQFITASAQPASLRPGRSGHIILTLDSEKLRSYGLTRSSFYVSRFAGDRVGPDNEINLSATLLPELSYTDEELANAPVATLDSTTIDMGAFGKKKRLKTEVQLRNTGGSPLKIIALQVYNPGLGVRLSKRVLAPGQSDKLKITVNASANGLKGRRRVLLITNDPQQPQIVIDILIKR